MTVSMVSYGNVVTNPAYQVEFLNICKGRRVAATKRRIRWRFGFGNPAAIEKGLSNIECRGAEHECVFLWSIASGKQRVLVDGVEVHFGTGSRRLSDRFELSWTMQGGHELKIIAHATTAFLKSSGNDRQFDLIVDGRSFDELPHIYELGRDTSFTSTAGALLSNKRTQSTPNLVDMASFSSSSPSSTSAPLRIPTESSSNTTQKPGPPRRALSIPAHFFASDQHHSQTDADDSSGDLICFDDDDDSITASIHQSSNCSAFQDLYTMGSIPVNAAPMPVPHSAQTPAAFTASPEPGPPRRVQSVPAQLFSQGKDVTPNLISFDDDSATTASMSPSSSYSIYDDPIYQQRQSMPLHQQHEHYHLPRAVSHGSLLHHQQHTVTPTQTGHANFY